MMSFVQDAIDKYFDKFEVCRVVVLLLKGKRASHGAKTRRNWL